MAINQPDIFQYDDFRKWLADTYKAAKAEDNKYSHRYFSLKAGYRSPSWLLQIINGDKNLTNKGIEGLAGAFRLTQEERIFFRDLVTFGQAKTHVQRNDAFERMAANRHFRRALDLDHTSLEYLSHWYYVAIREMLSLPDFQEDPHWISKRLLPPIHHDDVRKALEVLHRCGLLAHDEQGQLQPINTGTDIKGRVASLAAVRYHRQMLERAADSFDIVRAKHRHFGVGTVAISRDNFLHFKEKLDQLVKQFAEAGDTDTDPDAVYQLYVSLFPLTRPSEDSSS